MMAVDLHNTDQSLLCSSNTCFSLNELNYTTTTNSSTTWSCFSDSGSVLGSPVESELGSTETEEESDPEEDYCAELSRQMAHYMLQEDDKREKSWGGSSNSPQSTLWSPFGSNHETPKAPSREPSPPLPTTIEELEKLKINNHFNNYSEFPSSISNQTADFHSKQALIDDQIRAIQFYKLKQEQAMKQQDNKKQLNQYQNKIKPFGGFNNGQKTSTSSSWSSMHHHHQTQTSSGMRAVFLGGSASSRASSCGTGVFLPRGTGYTPDQSRKKAGCATVLIPARVVQALRQHFDKVGAGGLPSRLNGTTTPLQHDAVLGGKNSFYILQQQQQNQSMNKQEIGLPQEWTY